jgi:hypothetical protein
MPEGTLEGAYEEWRKYQLQWCGKKILNRLLESVFTGGNGGHASEFLPRAPIVICKF